MGIRGMVDTSQELKGAIEAALAPANEAPKAWPSCAHRVLAIRGRLQANAFQVIRHGETGLVDLPFTLVVRNLT